MIILTEKLYDNDAYLKEFEATVISCTPFEQGYKVILDKTAFFPEEGGQYSDRGFLDTSTVFDVQIEGESIVHYCSDCLSGNVIGKIDFDRRFRNMQNHTGEHIISGLVHTLFAGENVGFHLGEDEVTCDYDIELSAQQIEEIELEANKAIYKNLSVSAYYPTKKQLREITYRCKKEIDNDIRIVTIDDIDCCACCAPHVKTTGEVGIIKIISSMRLRGGIRLFISCGLDAFLDYSLKHNQIKSISSLLAVKPHQCAEGVEKIKDSQKEAVREINFLKGKINEIKIEQIEKTDNNLLIFTDKTDNDTLRNIVNKAKVKAGNICAGFAGNDTDGYSYIIYSDTEDLTLRAKEINNALCGRGGGKNPMIQGSVKAGEKEIKNHFSSFKTVSLK